MSTPEGIEVKGPDGAAVAQAPDNAGALILMAALHGRTGLPYRIEGVGWIGERPVADPQQLPQFGLSAQIDTVDPAVYHFVILNASVDTEVNFGDGESLTVLADGDPSFGHAFADPGTYHVTARSGSAFAEVYVNPGDAPVTPATVGR